MSMKPNDRKGPEKHGRKPGAASFLVLPMIIAAAALVLFWFYMSALAPLQIHPSHSQDCFVYKSVAWIVATPANKILFGGLLAVVFLIGCGVKGWMIAYYRLVTVATLLATVVVAWDLSSPVNYVAKLINRLLDFNLFA